MNSDVNLIKVGRIGEPKGRHDGNLVYDPEGICPTILARDYKGPTKVIELTPSERGVPIKNATKQGYLLAYDGDGIDISYLTSKTKRGRVQPQMSQTLTTSDNIGVILFEE